MIKIIYCVKRVNSRYRITNVTGDPSYMVLNVSWAGSMLRFCGYLACVDHKWLAVT